jgi:hypothetical protein
MVEGISPWSLLPEKSTVCSLGAFCQQSGITPEKELYESEMTSITAILQRYVGTDPLRRLWERNM